MFPGRYNPIHGLMKAEEDICSKQKYFMASPLASHSCAIGGNKQLSVRRIFLKCK